MPLALAAGECSIIVAGEMTKAGSEMIHAAPAHPIYYALNLTGYTDSGKQWGTGDRETAPLPSNDRVLQLVTQELATQSYFPVAQTYSSSHPERPSLILNVYWGFLIDPHISRKGMKVKSVIPPSSAMLNLIGASDNLQTAKGDYPQDARVPRYYIIIDSYDYSAFEKFHKKELLWRTKMSVPAPQWETLAATLGPMLHAGCPEFGKKLALPLNVVEEEASSGSAQVGKTTGVGGKP